MLTSSDLERPYDHTTTKNSAKPWGFALLILIPLGIYGLFRFFEPEVLSFVEPYLPKGPDRSHLFLNDLLHLVFSEMLWLSGFLLLAWIIGVYVPINRLVDKMEAGITSRPLTYVTTVISLSFVVSLIVSYYTLDQFPNSSDEYVYLYQAETFSKGKLWEQAHALPDFFYFNHIAQKDGLSVGRFPPGWPAILSLAFFAHVPPFLVNPFLGLVSLIVFYFLGRKLYGQRVTLWALPALALTSFYIFNSASYFSHTSCLLCTLVFVLGVYQYRDRQKIKYLLMAGFALGIMMTIRYYTALIVFLPFFVFLLYQYRLKAITVFFWIGIGSLPCVVAGFWYNYSITGNPLLPVTMWAYHDESLGFVKGHTVIKGMEHLTRWILMFLYWCSPAIVILYFIYLWKKIRHKAERLIHPEDYIFILLLAGYFFYYEIGGNQYGPRFFFEALPFVVLTVVSRLFNAHSKWAMALFLSGMIYGIVKLPFIAVREHQVVEERKDVYRQVNEQHLTNAIVFLSSHTGVIRPMPAGDLTRNDQTYNNDVLYVLDLKERNEELIRFYPDRKFYRYVKYKEEVAGKLVRVTTPPPAILLKKKRALPSP
jgi:hypothetical protein